MNNELLNKIISLVLAINADTKADINLHFAGHAELVSVIIYKKGYAAAIAESDIHKQELKPDYHVEFFYKGDKALLDLKPMSEVYDELQEIYKNLKNEQN